MSKNNQLKAIKIGNATCVKFTQQEHAQISKDRELIGESIPSLLKNAYFNGSNRRPLLDSESAKEFIFQLKKIGVNLNQIAKQLNTGVRYGWYEELQKIDDHLRTIRNLLVAENGRNNN